MRTALPDARLHHVSIGVPVPVPTGLPRILKPTRSGPVRPATTARPTTRAIPAEPARAAPPHPPGDHHQAEAHSHRLAGRLHHAPGAGGDAAEVLAEVRRRLAVGPELAEVVAEAVAGRVAI